MAYSITFTPRADEDLAFFKRSQPHNYKKASQLLDELVLHPKEGSGQPERLKYDLTGKWSRRIDDEHRMVYTIDDYVVKVEVLRMRYHYE
jgi:toxin YoeB